MTSDRLLEAYRQAATIHGEALEVGNARRCNKAYGELSRIRRELRRLGPEHLRKLLTLLDDENVAVRRSAAADALDFAPEEGLRVLREIAGGPETMVQFDAEMILTRWEAGEWQGGGW